MGRLAPSGLTDLLNIGNPDALGKEDRFNKLFTNVDLVVVEVSLVRIIDHNGWSLQINRFREHAVDLGGAESDLSLMFSPRERTIALEMLTKSAPSAAKFLKRHTYKELDKKEIFTESNKLRALIDAPVYFVGTLTHDFQGKPIPQRVAIREALAEIAEVTPHTAFFDPTPMIDAAGARQSMIDLGHHTPAFERQVADAFIEQVERFGQSDSQMQGLKSRRHVRIAARSAT